MNDDHRNRRTDFRHLRPLQRPQPLAESMQRIESTLLSGIIRTNDRGTEISPVSHLVYWFEDRTDRCTPIIHSSLSGEKSLEMFTQGIIRLEENEKSLAEFESEIRVEDMAMVWTKVFLQKTNEWIGHINQSDPHHCVFLCGDHCSVWFERSQLSISLRSYRTVMTGQGQFQPRLSFILEKIKRNPVPSGVRNVNQWCKFYQKQQMVNDPFLGKGHHYSGAQIRSNPELMIRYHACSGSDIMSALKDFPYFLSRHEKDLLFRQLRTFYMKKSKLYFNISLIQNSESS